MSDRRNECEDLPENKWLIRQLNSVHSFLVYFKTSRSPSDASNSLNMMTFKAWKLSSIRLVAPSMSLKLFSGNGPLNSNSDDAEARRVESNNKLQLLKRAKNRYKALHVAVDETDGGDGEQAVLAYVRGDGAA